MGIKGKVFLAVILVILLNIIIDLTVPEGNLYNVLNGLSVGITVLFVNLYAGKIKINFKNKNRRKS